MASPNEEAARLSGERITFSFGRNWQRFLAGVTDEKVAQAAASLERSFDGAPLAGRTFLDVGSGSGLFSCAARRAGALVTSVDVDPAAVACARQLAGGDDAWTVRQASVLDARDLPSAERVYSWGVLHHTGAMWEAVRRTLDLVAPGGLACIALYVSPRAPAAHLRLKRLYNRAPAPGRIALKAAYAAWMLLHAVRRGENPVTYVREYGRRSRGMSFLRDVEDWLGGLPIEYADEASFRAHLPEGFDLVRTLPGGPGACSEYLVRRPA